MTGIIKLYSQFGELEKLYIKYRMFPDTLYMTSKHILKNINDYILHDIFLNNDLDWCFGDIDEWFISMFYIYQTKQITYKNGYMNHLYKQQYHNNIFNFCAICKTTLTNLITKKLIHINKMKLINTQTQIKNDEVNRLFFELDNILSEEVYNNFEQILSNKERELFHNILHNIYKLHYTPSKEELMSMLHIKKDRYYQLLRCIRKKIQDNEYLFIL